MIVWDDVGYGAMDVFGGPIETPTMRRIANSGLRYRTSTRPRVDGTIDRVIVDVSGDHYVDHEREVLAYIARD